MRRRVLACVLALACVPAIAVQAARTRAAAGTATTVIANQEVALSAAAGSLVLPSAIYGTHGSVLEQVDEVTAKIKAMLEAGDLKVSDLMRHTIFLKAGAQQPSRIFTRLIGNLRRMGPELTNSATAGTIVLVPSFPDPATEIMVELVAGRAPDGMTRVPIMFGPRMSVESIGNEQFVASFGLEGLDFYGTGFYGTGFDGTGGSANETLDEELDKLVGNLGAVMGHAGLALANVVSYKLYVTKGTNPVDAAAKLHRLMRRRMANLNDYPSAGTVVVLGGATLPGLRVQLTVIASRSPPASLSRVPLGEVPADVPAQSVSAGGAVFVSGVGGIDYRNNGAIAGDAAGQAQVAARSIGAALGNAGGLKLSDVARFDIYIKHGEDPVAALAAFYSAARQLDASFDQKQTAAVVAMVDGFPRSSTRFLVSAVAARR